MDRYPRRDDLREMTGYHSPQVSVPVRLNTNESPIEPPAEFVAALADALSSVRWNRYPDRAAMALRTAIGALHGLGPERIFVANGSNEVLQSVLLAYGGHDRSVAMFEPTYQLHAHIAHVTGARVARGRRKADFSLDLDEVARVCASAVPSVTFLCSPNNPTGMVDSPSDIAAVIERAPGIVIVDEAYAQFAPHTALDLVRDDAHVAVSRTFSKTWSMAAARIGYLVAPTWMVNDLEIVTLPYHLDTVKQLAGRLALEYMPQMEAGVRAVVSERERMLVAMRSMPLTVWPSQANFILFRPMGNGTAAGTAVGTAAGTAVGTAVGTGAGTAAGTATSAGRHLWQHLLDAGVLVRDCSSWEGLSGCLRVTVGTAEENDAFLAALRSGVAARD